MNRVIKFRMWSGTNMLYDIENVYDCLKQQHVHDKTQDSRGFTLPYDHKAEGGAWMQFTGLHDKNGKEIYEGDILSFENKFTYEVCFEDAKFVCVHGAKSNSLRGIVWGPLHRFFDPDFLIYGGVEVIGNIYQNPELLK